MKRFAICLSLSLALLAAAPAAAGEGVTAQAAFDQLKALAGTWRGPTEGEGAEPEATAVEFPETVHEIEVSAGGTVVMETMGPGEPTEMINVYHLDGDDLVLTHYCAGGNQPKMRLDRGASSESRLVFAYDGGTNHDPAVDHHIHSAEIELLDADRMVSRWTAWAGGASAGRMFFHLSREAG